MVPYSRLESSREMMQGYVRIIGGKWRGKKLAVPSLPGLRPTPDRVRETVFNWLQPHIAGADCLDLFAGSGAFGLEALSRGASSVTMVDSSDQVIALLKQHVRTLQAESAAILYRALLPEGLLPPKKPYAIVFIDPPYDADLLFPVCKVLENSGFLADSSFIYLEARTAITEGQLPPNWSIIKAKKAGTVMYHLVKRKGVS